MSDEYLFRVTHALLRSKTTLAAVRALHGNSERAAVEGLVELVYRHPTAGEAVAAIGALEASTNPIIRDTLCAALDSPHPSVRLAAVEGLQRRRLKIVEVLLAEGADVNATDADLDTPLHFAVLGYH